MTATDGAGSRQQRSARPAGERFALFAECTLLGLLVLLASLPVVTWFAALAAGGRSLERYVEDGPRIGARPFLDDLRSTLPVALVPGLLGLALLALLAVDVAVATSGLPGGELVAVAVALCGLAALVVLVRAAVRWRPGRSWSQQLAAAARRAAQDRGGSALLAAGLVVVPVATWQLFPLLVPALGCLVMAALAVERSREAGRR